MPVRYSKDSAGPSTRRVLSQEMIEDMEYYSMSKAELQAEAEKQGLPKSGTKNELIERLQDAN